MPAVLLFFATAGLVVLVAAPYCIESGLEKWLKFVVQREVSIEDVDFKPFLGELALHSIQLMDQGSKGGRCLTEGGCIYVGD